MCRLILGSRELKVPRRIIIQSTQVRVVLCHQTHCRVLGTFAILAMVLGATFTMVIPLRVDKMSLTRLLSLVMILSHEMWLLEVRRHGQFYLRKVPTSAL